MPKPLEEYDRMTHPHPDLRFVLCQEATYSSLIDNNLNDLAEEWGSIQASVVREVSIAWRLLKLPGGNFENLAYNGQGLRARFDSIVDAVRELHANIRRWDGRFSD